MTAQVIERLEDVRPGDLYLGPIGGVLGGAIRAAQVIVDGGWRVGPLHVEHIGIVVEASRNLPGTPEAPATHRGQVYSTGVQTAPRMVQAMPRGAEEIALTYAKHWTPKVAYARIPEDYPGQAADAAEIARLMVREKVAYSFASYPALGLYNWGYQAPRLTEWIGRRRPPMDMLTQHPVLAARCEPIEIRLPVEAICSVLADQCWSLAGKRVMDDDRSPQAVTPSQLGQRLLTDMPGVIWGWPKDRPHP